MADTDQTETASHVRKISGRKSVRRCLAAALVILPLASCTTYRVPSLEPPLSQSRAKVHGEWVNISGIILYLRRADWSSERQPFTVWKVWTELAMADGTVIRILHQGPDFSSFRVVGVQGEYYIRPEDCGGFDAALKRVLR